MDLERLFANATEGMMTHHELSVRASDGGWEATIVFDT
jgi:hypothetical protein